MSGHAYTEDQLVEQPAVGLFAELGWQTVSAMEEVFGATGTLGRETPGEVVLVPRLRAALEKLNPTLPPEVIATAVVPRPGILFERLAAVRCKYMISSEFLFE